MTPFLHGFVLILPLLNASSIRLGFVNDFKHFNGPLSCRRRDTPGRGALNRSSALGAVSRTGVCVPEDVALFGRTVISYECLYTKDGRTQTGDEWEAEMTAETKATFPGKDTDGKKQRYVNTSHEPDAGFERLEFPAPFNPAKMLLRGGVPYLRISVWAPGLRPEDFRIFLNYTSGQEYPASYVDAAEPLPEPGALSAYYEAFENEPAEQLPKYSYHSTYNDLFNAMEKAEYGFADVDSGLLRPPLLLVNFPKNTVVNQWEHVTFGAKRDPERRRRLMRTQRAYRPFSHVDLREVACTYRDSALQLLFKLVAHPPPPDFQKNYRLAVAEGRFRSPADGAIKPPRALPFETVHGWMYNWHFFPKYDVTPPEDVGDAVVVKPRFVDDMSPRQVRQFIREVDERHRKGLDFE